MKSLWSAPAHRINRGRHLLSPVHCLAFIAKDLPWRTFTMSRPLQPSVGLLRRLRPLSRPLAFSRPLRGARCHSSLIPARDISAPRSCLLDAGRSSGATLPAHKLRKATALPFWSWRSISQFRQSVLTTLHTQVSRVSIGCRGSPSSPFWLSESGRSRRASHPSTCRVLTQAAYPSHRCLNEVLIGQYLPPLVGALLPRLY
jgi:hypothetical protein